EATDVERHIFSIREVIPVRGGEPVTLLYPQWLPGNHSPSGRVDKLAGLTIHGNSTRLEWARDVVDVFAFHVAVPAGITSLDVEFQFASSIGSNEGRVVMTPDMLNLQLEAHRALVSQAYKLYGSHHYDHYDFLLAVTDHMGGIGLEHHQSSENATVPGYFTEWDKSADARDLLPHEYSHSWNGKFRRPADLWTPNFNGPMRDSLLWVY